jgi:hypothetical protein
MPGDFGRREQPADQTDAGLASPCFVCEISLPDGARAEFGEFDTGGMVCGARRIEFQERGPGVRRRVEGARVFGSVAEVIGASAGVAAGDPWVAAVCRALQRDREWAGELRHRRSELSVVPGEGELFHVTAAVNRESIRRHGLDWRRMGAAPGIAGSSLPERAAVFVCGSRDEAGFFLQMAGSPSDVWAVRADGLWVENGPQGWSIITDPVEPGRLRLACREVPPEQPADDPVHSGPSAAYQSELTIRRADGTAVSWGAEDPRRLGSAGLS